ncbi:MAG: hypothetical protein ACPGWR_25960, partial [Ardenticatenaceae bacterium]
RKKLSNKKSGSLRNCPAELPASHCGQSPRLRGALSGPTTSGNHSAKPEAPLGNTSESRYFSFAPKLR